MKRISGQSLGLWSLRLDAIYCTILGLLVAICAPQIAQSVAISQQLLVIAGIAVVLWAGILLGMLSRLSLRRALWAVMVVNVLAALLVAVCAVAGGTMLAVASIIAIAVDIALFAGSQALALRRLSAARPV